MHRSHKRKNSSRSIRKDTFAIEIVLMPKIEQLVKQKLFRSYKLNSEEKSTGSANENASMKNDINFIVAPVLIR